MIHVLDNPIYNALISNNKTLANGSKNVVFFRRDVAPFAGFKNNSEKEFGELYEATHGGDVFVIFTPVDLVIPKQWNVVRKLQMLQMVYEGEIPSVINDDRVTKLESQHIPEMLSLTQLTAPGPFLEHTIEFGNYTGIFEDNKLVAMAGHRMQPSPYVEISAVCTHPDYIGRGYAATLLNTQIKIIIEAGKIPFLHVLDSNTSAIRVYERLGFKTRMPMLGYVLSNSKQ